MTEHPTAPTRHKTRWYKATIDRATPQFSPISGAFTALRLEIRCLAPNVKTVLRIGDRLLMKSAIKHYRAQSLADFETQTIYVKLKNLTVDAYSFISPNKKERSL